jgi:hypothetical protein
LKYPTDEIVFDVLTSNLLTPFRLACVLKALLPIDKDAAGDWSPVGLVKLAADPGSRAAFEQILAAFGKGKSVQDLFDAIDSDRRKLTQQHIPADGFLVFTGAGGKLVCAAYAPLAAFNAPKLIVDQTLYWAPVPTEDEAIYLTGLFNSEAINAIIQEFQPRGAFGERHVHTLAHEATPPFDPSQAAHQEVLVRTKQLLLDYEALLASDARQRALLEPNATKLDVRRRRIRDAIKKLPSYAAYELACRDLYGV